MDQTQYDALYAAQWDGLVRQVTAVCGDPVEAADCVQEAFVKAWERRRELDADAGGWVRTAALRIAVSRWRRARNAVLAWSRDSHQRGGAQSWLLPERQHDAPVWRALAALPMAQRQALVLHHVVDLGVAQVAEVLGVPEGTVKARLSRGRAALALALGDDDVRRFAAGPADGRTPEPRGGTAVPTPTEGVR